jgi:hypothetical protein
VQEDGNFYCCSKSQFQNIKNAFSPQDPSDEGRSDEGSDSGISAPLIADQPKSKIVDQPKSKKDKKDRLPGDHVKDKKDRLPGDQGKDFPSVVSNISPLQNGCRLQVIRVDSTGAGNCFQDTAATTTAAQRRAAHHTA